MIEHELLFLGLLADGPRHGYEIKRQIKDDLSRFVSLDIKSVYYPLAQMEKRGLVSRAAAPQDKGPARNIYAITPKGRERFQRLLTESFLTIERPFFRMNLSLYFSRHMDRSTVVRRLRARVAVLKRVLDQFEAAAAAPFAAADEMERLILQHDLDLIRAEVGAMSRLETALSASGAEYSRASLTNV